jgi:hypothetical protein
LRGLETIRHVARVKLALSRANGALGYQAWHLVALLALR